MSKIYLFSTSSHSDAISINSLDIKFLKPYIDFALYDYLIITSKQASYSLKQYSKEFYTDKEALCVSTKSALSFEEIGGKALEVGNGYGDDLSKAIQKYPKSTKWLYLRANIVASNFVDLCKNDGYDIKEVVVYESSCSKEILDAKVQENATLIFTSPSSIVCYLKSNEIKEKNSVIVIGKTTAKALPKGINYRISKKTTIDSCLELVN